MNVIGKFIAQGIGAFAAGVAIDRAAAAVDDSKSSPAPPSLKPPPPKQAGSGNALLYRLFKVVAPKGKVSTLVETGGLLARVGDAKPISGTRSAPSRFSTGNSRLMLLASRIDNGENANPAAYGAGMPIRDRQSLLRKAGTIASDPGVAMQRASKMANGIRTDLAKAHGAAKLASGKASLKAGDGIRVVKADVMENVSQLVDGVADMSLANAVHATFDGALKSAEAAYAVATTTPDGLHEVAEAIGKRIKFEGTAVATGIAVSHAAASAIGMVPHPAFRIAASAIRVTTSVASGAKISETLGGIDGGRQADGAVRQEIGKILIEKSAEGRSSKT